MQSLGDHDQDHPEHRENNENLDKGETGATLLHGPKPATGPSRALSSTKLCSARPASQEIVTDTA